MDGSSGNGIKFGSTIVLENGNVMRKECGDDVIAFHCSVLFLCGTYKKFGYIV